MLVGLAMAQQCTSRARAAKPSLPGRDLSVRLAAAGSMPDNP
jgi:hypothetical protein